MRRLVSVGLLAGSVVVVGLPSLAASAAVDLEEVAAELRNNPVYVAEDAQRQLNEEETAELRDTIGGADTPIYVAVLPDSAADVAGGDPAEVASMLADAVDRTGTYGVVVGDTFRAGSTELAEGEAGELAVAALDANGEDTAAVLTDFVQRVGDAAESVNGAATSNNATEDDDDGGGAGWVLPVVLAGGAGVAGVLVWQRSKKRRAEAAERAKADAAEREMLKAEVAVLADDVVRLETEVQLHPDAQGDFDAAVSRYRAAQAALESTGQRLDLVRVGRVVSEARYLMDRVRAIIAGREPPPPPDDLQRPGQHGEPALTLDENRQPAYAGYPGGGFQNGWFGGTSGLFSGLLLGSLMFGGWGHGGTTIINESGDGGGDGGSDGGDSGGGDFGGGDFGGGDFGGGDFGGGDF